jgi:hypothetical protein
MSDNTLFRIGFPAQHGIDIRISIGRPGIPLRRVPARRPPACRPGLRGLRPLQAATSRGKPLIRATPSNAAARGIPEGAFRTIEHLILSPLGGYVGGDRMNARSADLGQAPSPFDGTTLGLEARLATRLQPNLPTDDPRGIAASTRDGLLYGVGDAVIGINPATDTVSNAIAPREMRDALRHEYRIPSQICVLTHVTNCIEIMNRGAPVDLVFRSIAGTEAADRGVGIDLGILREASDAARLLNRDPALPRPPRAADGQRS